MGRLLPQGTACPVLCRTVALQAILQGRLTLPRGLAPTLLGEIDAA